MSLVLDGAGGGAGSVRVAIRSDNDQPAVFATFAALEAYTATQSGTEDANRISVSSAERAEEAFVVGTLTNNAFTGEVTSYIRVGTEWVLSIAPLVGLPGADGMGALDQSIPVGTVLAATQASPGDPIVPGVSALVETSSMIETSKGLDSAFGILSNGNIIAGAGAGFVGMTPYGRAIYAIGSEYTEEGGTTVPRFLDAPAASYADIQTDDSQTISGSSIQFIFASTATGIALEYEFKTELTTGIDGCNFVSEAASHGSGRTFFNYIKDNGGTGFRIPSVSETTNGKGLFRVRLPTAVANQLIQNMAKFGAFFLEGDPTYVTISSPNGEVIDLAGGPLTQPGITTQQVPRVRVLGSIGTFRDLLHAGNIDNAGTTTELLEAAEIDRRIHQNIATFAPVSVGQTFEFEEGHHNYHGTVFSVNDSTFEISFSNGELDIPGVSGAEFHVEGAFLVSQYSEGLVFSRVRSTSATSGVGDIDAVVVGSISFTDGQPFSPPNTQSGVRLGVMSTQFIPDTEVGFEVVRGSTGVGLGVDFSQPGYAQTRQVVFTLLDSSEVAYAVANVLLPNQRAIGPLGGGSSAAAVITGATVSTSNPLQVIVDLASPIDLTASTNSSSNVAWYEATIETVRHIVVAPNSGAQLSNGTLTLTRVGGSGFAYTDVAENNELVAGTGNEDEAKGSGITLTNDGRIPFEFIGEGDVTLSGSGGSITIDVNNIDTYKDRTIFVNHSNTFTINLDSVADFHNAGDFPFFLRFVNQTEKLVAVQGPTSHTVGGRARQLLGAFGSITIELPASGQTNYPILAAGNPLRRFDIVQVTSSQTYSTPVELERICDHLLEVNGTNLSITLASSDLDCAFRVHNIGTDPVTLLGSSAGGGSSATITGHTQIKPGDLAFVWNSNQNGTYYSILIGNTNGVVPLLLNSPDGTTYEIAVDNSGNLSAVST